MTGRFPPDGKGIINELELLYIISGSIDLFVCSMENVLKVGKCSASECMPETCPKAVKHLIHSGESFVIQIDSIHSAIFKEDTEFIAISVPASDQFPGSNEREVPSAGT